MAILGTAVHWHKSAAIGHGTALFLCLRGQRSTFAGNVVPTILMQITEWLIARHRGGLVVINLESFGESFVLMVWCHRVYLASLVSRST